MFVFSFKASKFRILFAVVLCALIAFAAVVLLLTKLHFGEGEAAARILRITIPENLEYDGLFDDLFAQYTRSHTLQKVKTTNMGTLYELHYRILLKTPQVPKAFLDEIRCRNGNLEITISQQESVSTVGL